MTADITFTNQQLVVVDEADGTLASEAAYHVDTHSVLTHTWDFPALVDIYGMTTTQRMILKTCFP